MLSGIFEDEMPYRDPHTAAPALWALRESGNASFEVSIAIVDGSAPWRKALEATAIALYRQETGASPTANFGRMPRGFRISSGNNARLVASGKRFRGGPTQTEDECHLRGVRPVGLLGTGITSPQWCGHGWYPWRPLQDLGSLLRADDFGLYRLRSLQSEDIVYIGEGRIRGRLQAHARRARDASHPQGRVLSSAGPLEGSWALNGVWRRHQRLELEVDLVGAYVLARGHAPAAQFIG